MSGFGTGTTTNSGSTGPEAEPATTTDTGSGPGSLAGTTTTTTTLGAGGTVTHQNEGTQSPSQFDAEGNPRFSISPDPEALAIADMPAGEARDEAQAAYIQKWQQNYGITVPNMAGDEQDTEDTPKRGAKAKNN